MEPIIDVIIPVLNEQNAVGLVIDEIPKSLTRNIIVVDNGSTDDTPAVAKKKGAIVLNESKKGYGNACQKGINYISNELTEQPTVVVFLDGDHSDFPEHMSELTEPIHQKDMDLVIGSRALGKQEEGSMTLPQRFGNWLSTKLIRWIYGVKFTDLGPFRAVKYQSLMALDMQDQTYGWTVEMQVKAARLKMKTCEVPVNYRQRIGVSKISGTIKGTILAGYKILATIFKYS